MDTKQGKLRGGGGVMNWAIGIDMYTLMYLKLMTNKDLLYKKIKKLKIKEEQECREKGILVHCWWECKLMQPLWKTVWRFLKKLKIGLLYDPAIPLLSI